MELSCLEGGTASTKGPGWSEPGGRVQAGCCAQGPLSFSGSLFPISVSLTASLAQVFSPLALLTFGAETFSVGRGGHPMYCGMVSSTPGLYTVDASCSPPPSIVPTKNVSRHHLMSSGVGTIPPARGALRQRDCMLRPQWQELWSR